MDMIVYDNPADESRAPELWKNSAQWLKVERLLYIHADIIKEMRSHLHELAAGDPREELQWLGAVPDELEKLTGQWDRDIIAPTSSLSDLMYKSVGIRDARHSLQLGLSMWRLSWITFIFLPLTFTVGFFGMNVDTFAENPSIKWWYVSFPPCLPSLPSSVSVIPANDYANATPIQVHSLPPNPNPRPRPLVRNKTHALNTAPKPPPQRRLRSSLPRARHEPLIAVDTPRSALRRRASRLVERI